jgi:DNA-binding GntR family transcriptional regulator
MVQSLNLAAGRAGRLLRLERAVSSRRRRRRFMPPRLVRKASSALTPATRKSLGEDVAERLREAILRGELSPGQRLREEEVGERLQVSKAPVRDAFVRLEREGMVVSSPHRGVSVVELTHHDLQEIYTLRSVLEPLAITLAIQRATASDLADMDASLAEMTRAFAARITEREAARLDVQFHDTIYAAAHHQRLSSAWERIRLPTYWFLLSRTVASPDWRDATVSGHAEILQSIKEADESLAAEKIKAHIAFAYERILQSYLNSGGSAESAEGAHLT